MHETELSIVWCHCDVCFGSGATLQHQQQAMEFADEEEELLRDHEQSLRQLEVLTAFMSSDLL